MRMTTARAVLIALFLLALVLQLVTVFAVRRAMWPEDFQSLILKIITTYSVPLAVVLGNLIARPHARSTPVPRTLAWSAIVLTLLWNLLLVARAIDFALASEDSATALMSYFDAVAASSSFLIAGIMSFFFEKSANVSAAE
jgi:hypothetical protein